MTDAIVGTFDLIRNVGRISNNDATTTASNVSTVNSTGARSHLRCHATPTKRPYTPMAGPAGVAVAGGAMYVRVSGAASITGTSYAAGR